MGSSLVQTPINKNSELEFVDRATQIVDLIYTHLEKCCPACQALLKTVLREPTSQEPETIPEPPKNNHV